MKNDSCIICGNKFEPREGKMYCSDSCKSYAYNQRKKGAAAPLILPEQVSGKPVLWKIDYQEYLQVNAILNEKNKNCVNDIVEYAFYRKNLSGIVDHKTIADYIENIMKQVYIGDDPKDEERFEKFKNQFLEGQVLITNEERKGDPIIKE